METPLRLRIMDGRMEMDTATIRFKEKQFVGLSLHTRSFAYEDLILMNETLRAIMGNHK